MSFSWIPFYTELSGKLLDYRRDRQTMIAKIVKAYETAGIPMPKMDSTNIPVDMDPFTVFGTFNKKMKDVNRIALCSALKELFGVDAEAPSDFDSIPVLNPLNATFYAFADDAKRGEHDIDNLWECFATAIRYADASDETSGQAFAQAFDKVKMLKGNRWKLTMSLYWIRPRTYLNLDGCNRSFLTGPGSLGDDFAVKIRDRKHMPDGKAYLSICEECRERIAAGGKYSDICELSYAAWKAQMTDADYEEDEGKTKLNTVGVMEQDVAVRYWIYLPGLNSRYWDKFYAEGIMALDNGETGDAKNFSTREEIMEKLRLEWDSPKSPAKHPSNSIWSMLHEMKSGDIVYAKQGAHKIIGRGIVTSDYYYSEDYAVSGFNHQRKVKWTHKGEWEYPLNKDVPPQALTEISGRTDLICDLEALFSAAPEPVNADEYTPQDFLKEVYMDESEYHILTSLLLNKKNVILQGAPGVGKTFAARRLVYSMMGKRDDSRIEMVQFHQSYSYEDFVMGYRPMENGFELKNGVFYNFCKKAAKDPGNIYSFIIDEINRGNLSKIFGELFMLIESDKRGVEMKLLYNDEPFSVPENVLIIGMMNTADRSLAMLDYALRRRFAFFEMEPGFDTNGFHEYREGLGSDKFDKLIACVKELNRDIENDSSLGEGFRIGHSYFCNIKNVTDDLLKSIVRFELIPLLKEYWFDNANKVKEWRQKLEDAVK